MSKETKKTLLDLYVYLSNVVEDDENEGVPREWLKEYKEAVGEVIIESSKNSLFDF